MLNLVKISLALIMAVFLASAPVIAAEMAAPKTPSMDPAAALKQKATDAVDNLQKKADNAAENAKDALGVKKAEDAAAGAKEEMVNVQQESVTVETPAGTATETTTVVTPEAPAMPQAPTAPAAK